LTDQRERRQLANGRKQSQRNWGLNMRLALHARSILHTNIATDVRVAREAGYEGIELWVPKLHRYLKSGHTVGDLKRLLGPLRVVMIDALLPIETLDPRARDQLIEECEFYAEVAEELECGAIQVVALDDFSSDEWTSQRESLTSVLGEMSDRAQPHGVRLAIEPVVFSRFHSVNQALDLVAQVGPDRVGLCLDTWHLWTTHTDWAEVAAIPAELIAAVQLSDTMPKSGDSWCDEDRRALPGDGILPLEDAIRAIASTGYDGAWSVEMLSVEHWEWDPYVLAEELRQRVVALASKVGLD
jgi:sugar phosphate isomerase/epimerase